MTILDPVETRLRRIEADITQLRVDVAAIKARVDAMPTLWALVALIAPMYLVIILGLAGLFFTLLSRLPGGAS